MIFSQFKQLYLPLALILLIFIFGIAGYMLIEDYNFFDALYMSVITIATVGFSEIKPLSHAGRMFTVILIITSIGTFALAITRITQYVVDGDFQRVFRNFRSDKKLSKMKNHVIICGYGRNGKQAANKLKTHQTPFVVIESNEDEIASFTELDQELIVIGDATHDEVLIKAGINKARAIITTLPEDADNLFVVLTARGINPTIKIITRASEENSDLKLKRAGADYVIMPDKIGGAHMASMILKPNIVEFVNVLTAGGDIEFHLDELSGEELQSELHGKTIRELEIRNKFGANIIGFKSSDGQYIVNPSPDTIIKTDSKLFVLGSHEQINNLRKEFRQRV